MRPKAQVFESSAAKLNSRSHGRSGRIQVCRLDAENARASHMKQRVYAAMLVTDRRKKARALSSHRRVFDMKTTCGIGVQLQIYETRYLRCDRKKNSRATDAASAHGQLQANSRLNKISRCIQRGCCHLVAYYKPIDTPAAANTTRDCLAHMHTIQIQRVCNQLIPLQFTWTGESISCDECAREGKRRRQLSYTQKIGAYFQLRYLACRHTARHTKLQLYCECNVVQHHGRRTKRR